MCDAHENSIKKRMDVHIAEVDLTFGTIYAHPSEAFGRVIRLLQIMPSWKDAMSHIESKPAVLGGYLGTPTGVERQEAFRALRLLMSTREELNSHIQT